MRFQSTPGYCGVGAVINTLRAFGKRISEKNVKAITGTTQEDGTNENGIINALRYFGLKAEPYSGGKRNSSWLWLHGALMQGKCTILAVDNWGHWVVIVGTLHDRVVMIDSSPTSINRSENGVHILSRTALLKRWTCKKDVPEPYYGISASR